MLDNVNQKAHETYHENIFTACFTYEFFTLVPLNVCMFMPLKKEQGNEGEVGKRS